LEELLEETDAEETNENPGPQGARQDKRPGPHHPEDVFFDYDPSSAPSLLFHMTTTFNLNLTP